MPICSVIVLLGQPCVTEGRQVGPGHLDDRPRGGGLGLEQIEDLAEDLDDVHAVAGGEAPHVALHLRVDGAVVGGQLGGAGFHALPVLLVTYEAAEEVVHGGAPL